MSAARGNSHGQNAGAQNHALWTENILRYPFIIPMVKEMVIREDAGSESTRSGKQEFDLGYY